MINNEILFEEMTKAIRSYHTSQLSLSGLVNRLEELTNALADTGVKWGIEIDDFLLQLEIINSLVASGDKPSLSQKDIEDIEEYLRLISSEIGAHI